MLYVGAGGMAEEIVADLLYRYPDEKEIYFFDNTSHSPDLIFGQFPVMRTFEEAEVHFNTKSPLFVTAVANPLIRYRLSEKFKSIGGQLGRYLSDRSSISQFADIRPGVIIQTLSAVSPSTTLHEGVFMNGNAIVGHHCVIDPYVTLGPGCRILGHAHIGSYSYIGCNAIIMPGVRLGEKVRVGVGKIIEHDLPDNSKV